MTTNILRFIHSIAVGLVASGSLLAQTTVPPNDDKANETASADVVELSMFTVSAADDKGYEAGNSVSATRINTPIKDLPFAVSAFTDKFVSDIGTRELADILKFAPSVTSGSEGFSNGNALVMVRGFQSVPQRNGFYSPLYVDGSLI